MILLRNHDYTISQPVDYKLDMFVISNQNSVNLMIQHKIEEIYNVDNTKSSKLEMLLKKPNVISTKLLGQQALTITHVIISMNSNRSQ
jgi:hypothetical protein